MTEIWYFLDLLFPSRLHCQGSDIVFHRKILILFRAQNIHSPSAVVTGVLMRILSNFIISSIAGSRLLEYGSIHADVQFLPPIQDKDIYLHPPAKASRVSLNLLWRSLAVRWKESPLYQQIGCKLLICMCDYDATDF